MAAFALEVARVIPMDRRRHGVRLLEVTAAAIRRQTLVDALVVASPTFRYTMRALQRESRHVMVEQRLLPEVLQVAVAALLELTVVIVILRMANDAFLA